jgi:membrane dipeptidase
VIERSRIDCQIRSFVLSLFKIFDVVTPRFVGPCLLLSHTGLRSVCDSERNVDDDHLRMISAADGIVGIALFYPALCDKDDLLGSFVKSVVHAIRTIGVEHVAVGSDFDGGVHTSVDASDMRVIFAALVHFGGLSALEAHSVIYQNSLNFFRKCLPKS